MHKLLLLIIFVLSTFFSGISAEGLLEKSQVQGMRNEDEGSWVSPNDLKTNKHNAVDGSFRVDLTQFKKIVVNQSGRMKPLDTYAADVLLRFSGKKNIKIKDQKLSSIEWLALSLFEPSSSSKQDLFLINNPEVLEAFGIEPKKHRRYSYKDLANASEKIHDYAASAFEKEEDQQTSLDQEFIRVFVNLHTYTQILNSLQVFQPSDEMKIDDVEFATDLNLKTNVAYSLYDVIQHVRTIEEYLNNKPHEDALRLSLNLYTWIESHKEYMSVFNQDSLLDLFPIFREEQEQFEWITTWQNFLEQDDLVALDLLDAVYQSYQAADQSRFDQAVKAFNTYIKTQIELHQAAPRVELELIYNSINPLLSAKAFYLLAFLLLLMTTIFSSSWLRIAGQASTLIAFAYHLYAVVLRMLIMMRPPVSNLYETFIFVALITAGLGLFLHFVETVILAKKGQVQGLRNEEEGSWVSPNEQTMHERNVADVSFEPVSSWGYLLAALSGFILLMVSGKFAEDGDTMKVLIAVLDSNFWLSTHVIAITVGYAGVAFAGLLGHIYVIRRAFMNVAEDAQELIDLKHAILGTLGFGLCFSFLGTLLGGIWADQSWGRFWGWDPKENGALLIVLWSAIVFHARLGGLIKDFGLAITAVIGTVVVMISWLGVNLLGVGLHSYGFTSGLVTALLIYFIVEILFVVAAIIALRRVKTNQ